MIKILNDILTIVGLFVVAQIISILLISTISYLFRVFAKPSGMETNNQTKQRESSIYIPNYIKKLGGMIPQFTNKTCIKTTHTVPDLKDGEYQPLVKDIPDIINSPITEFKESPSDNSRHANNLPQEKYANFIICIISVITVAAYIILFTDKALKNILGGIAILGLMGLYVLTRDLSQLKRILYPCFRLFRTILQPSYPKIIKAKIISITLDHPILSTKMTMLMNIRQAIINSKSNLIRLFYAVKIRWSTKNEPNHQDGTAKRHIVSRSPQPEDNGRSGHDLYCKPAHPRVGPSRLGGVTGNYRLVRGTEN